MSSPEYLVEVNNLKKQFVVRHEGRSSLKHMIVRLLRPYPHEPFWALKGVDLQVRGGEIVGLIGANGAGKTTLIRIAMGMLEAQEGRVGVLGLGLIGQIAAQILTAMGYRAVGIDTLLREAGVAKMTLYKHFGSKEELIRAVLERQGAAITTDITLGEATQRDIAWQQGDATFYSEL